MTANITHERVKGEILAVCDGESYGPQCHEGLTVKLVFTPICFPLNVQVVDGNRRELMRAGMKRETLPFLGDAISGRWDAKNGFIIRLRFKRTPPRNLMIVSTYDHSYDYTKDPAFK